MGRKRKSKSLDGLERVYLHRGQWQYKSKDHEKLVHGAWVPLGTVNARSRYAAHMRKLSGDGEMDWVFDEYLLSSKSDGLAESTILSKIQELKLLRQTFGNMSASHITPLMCQKFYDKRRELSPTQANRELSTLAASLDYAASRMGLIDSNSARLVKRKKTKPRDRLPTVEEISAVKKHGDDFVKGVLNFIYITGCARRADICNLKRSEFGDTGYHPKTSKTNKKGFVPWTPDLRRAVEMLQSRNPKYIISAEYLVLGRNGKPLHVSAYNKRITKAMQSAIKAGDLQEKYNPHDVRASHATEAERQGLDPTQQLLHGDKKTTEIYMRDRRETKVTPLVPPE